jgi:hypothetical protein
MSSNQIPGVPEGWIIERIGKPIFNVDWVIGFDGEPRLCDYDSSYLNRVIIRKIEKPARYRPFANAAEFEPHRDRWVQYTSPSVGDCSAYRVSAYTSERVWLGPDNSGKEYKVAFYCLNFDDDGTPFGVKIDE